MAEHALILRHAATQMNIEKMWQGGELDPPLCPVGIDDLMRFSSSLATILAGKPVRVQSSPMIRARQTAQVLAEKLNNVGKIAIKPALSEARIGNLSGLSEEDIRSRFPTHFAKWCDGVVFDYPNGDTVRSLFERVSTVILTANSGVLLVTVTHQVVIPAIRQMVGLPPNASQPHLSGLMCTSQTARLGPESIWKEFNCSGQLTCSLEDVR